MRNQTNPVLRAWLRRVPGRVVAAALLIAGCWLGGTGVGAAAELEGVRFADRYQAAGVMLPLRGVGLARFLLTIKVYVAALYLGAGVPPERVLSDVPKRLELEYFQRIAGPDFGKAAEEVMAENVPASTLAALRPRIGRLHRLYEDVKPGDRYALTYVPGLGTELALNGVPKGVIEGEDFAAAYFAIWLGPKPISPSLKTQMLALP